MELKRGDRVEWALKFVRDKDPKYGLANERMIILKKNPSYPHPYLLKVISSQNKGQQKMAARNELIKIG